MESVETVSVLHAVYISTSLSSSNRRCCHGFFGVCVISQSVHALIRNESNYGMPQRCRNVDKIRGWYHRHQEMMNSEWMFSLVKQFTCHDWFLKSCWIRRNWFASYKLFGERGAHGKPNGMLLDSLWNNNPAKYWNESSKCVLSRILSCFKIRLGDNTVWNLWSIEVNLDHCLQSRVILQHDWKSVSIFWAGIYEGGYLKISNISRVFAHCVRAEMSFVVQL